MRILLIGGSGTISSAITRQLAETDHELWVLNRGNRNDELPLKVRQVITDIDDEADEDGEGESELIDPREYWYLESLTMDGDAIVASVYCYVGPGHYYEFTIDPSTGDLISAEETSQS